MESFQIDDKVTYRRQGIGGKPLKLVRGFIEDLTVTTCIIYDTATGDLVAAPLNRVERK